MKSFIILIISILILLPVGLHAQDEIPAVSVDTTQAFVPDPNKALLYSLVPGLGQIYNRKYWKLPIVYGGFLGCAYAITWNGTTYRGYQSAYHDITNNTGDSWKNYLPYYAKDNPDEWLESYRSNFTNQLKNARDFHRRNLELSVIVTVGLYALCIIDAYVDAQLFSFDMSNDLSMKIDPIIFEPSPVQTRSFGLQCSITF